jgi:hypothetical protein
MLNLLGARGMGTIEESVLDELFGLLFEGEPLKSQGWPFQFLNHQSIVQVSAVLHPYFVFLFRSAIIVLHRFIN